MRKSAAHDILTCRRIVCGVVFIVLGGVTMVAGGVVAAVGFATWPKDMYDIANQSMRVAGLVVACSGILPVIMGICFVFFYKSYAKQEKANPNPQMAPNSHLMPMGDYPHPTASRGQIYRAQNDSNDPTKFSSHDDSFMSVPLTGVKTTSDSFDMSEKHRYVGKEVNEEIVTTQSISYQSEASHNSRKLLVGGPPQKSYNMEPSDNNQRGKLSTTSDSSSDDKPLTGRRGPSRPRGDLEEEPLPPGDGRYKSQSSNSGVDGGRPAPKPRRGGTPEPDVEFAPSDHKSGRRNK